MNIKKMNSFNFKFIILYFSEGNGSDEEWQKVFLRIIYYYLNIIKFIHFKYSFMVNVLGMKFIILNAATLSFLKNM